MVVCGAPIYFTDRKLWFTKLVASRFGWIGKKPKKPFWDAIVLERPCIGRFSSLPFEFRVRDFERLSSLPLSTGFETLAGSPVFLLRTGFETLGGSPAYLLNTGFETLGGSPACLLRTGFETLGGSSARLSTRGSDFGLALVNLRCL